MFNIIAKEFKKKYRSNPKYITVAPGRVNLIGEHVDHQGYSVLPMALNRSIKVAIGFKECETSNDSDALFEIDHVNPSKFKSLVINTVEDTKICHPPVWTNYIIAGLLGLFYYKLYGNIRCDEDISKMASVSTQKEKLIKLLPETEDNQRRTVCILIDGNIPIAAGVSSSSALVVASSLAISKILNIELSRHMFAELCANSERYVGLAGGGMDQASITFGMTRLIHFNPLRVEEHVNLPPSAVFVVCNTCTVAPKALHLAVYYNKRVFELKAAAYLILLGEGEEEDLDKVPMLTLKRVQQRLGDIQFEYFIEIAKRHLPSGRISKHKLETMLGKEVCKRLINRVGFSVWDRNIYFELLQRVLHVCEEAQRVLKFFRTCQDKTLTEEEQLQYLGGLMNESNESLSLLFDCGSPELDELTSLAINLGAYGSRITGAGWGGCTVSLVHRNKVDEFLHAIKHFYFDRNDRLNPIGIPDCLEMALFSATPSIGAQILDGVTGNEIIWK